MCRGPAAWPRVRVPSACPRRLQPGLCPHSCPAPLGLLKQRTSFRPERVRGPGFGPKCSRSFLLACGIGESCCPKALCLLGAPGMASPSIFQPGGYWRTALQLTVVFPDIKTEGDSVGGDGPLPLERSGCACVDSRPREGRAPCPLCPPPGRFSWGRWQVPQLRGGSLLSGDDGCLTTRTASLYSQVAAGRLLAGAQPPTVPLLAQIYQSPTD